MSICSTGLGDSEPLVVSPKRGCQMLDCSMTRFYELLNSGQIESYREGKSRKAVVASIKAHIARQLEQEAKKEPARWTERATCVRMAKRSAKAKAPRVAESGR
jgi:hypothetical protein